MKQSIRLYFLTVAFPLLSSCSKSEAPAPAEAPPEKAAAVAAVASSAPVAAAPVVSGPALKVAYSDWPGWVAWDIAVQKGWFAEAGVNVEFKWFRSCLCKI